MKTHPLTHEVPVLQPRDRAREPRRLKHITGALLLSLLLGCATWPEHQASPARGMVGCTQTPHGSLLGTWVMDLPASGERWVLQLGPHPEHIGSWRGRIEHAQDSHAVVADLDGADFTMEESHDGQRIAATWLGQVVPGTCPLRIEGERLSAHSWAQTFVMQAKRP